MEPYLVSFRRHRPDSFLSVVGQTHITQTLKNSIRSDKLAQVMLFCGPRGVGKTTCARILAKTVNCLQPTGEAEACGQCKSCLSIRDGGSLAIYELDAASNNSVDDIRSLVEQVRYPPQGGKFKVYIIDEVHMLSTAAFNAFLKTLEEPPPYAIFILATTEKHKILPTILSRCQVYHFNRIRVPDIAGELERVCKSDGIPYEEQALFALAEKSDGALRDALSMLDQIVGFSGGQLRLEDVVRNLNLLDSRCFFDATDYILSGDFTSLLLLLQKIIVDGFETDAFLAGLASHWRLLLLARDERTRELLEMGKDSLPEYVRQGERLSIDIHLSGLNLLAQAELNHRQSHNTRLHAEMALAKLCYARYLLLPPDSDIPESTEPGGGRIPLSGSNQPESNPGIQNLPSGQSDKINKPKDRTTPIKQDESTEDDGSGSSAVRQAPCKEVPVVVAPAQEEPAQDEPTYEATVQDVPKIEAVPIKVSRIKSPHLNPTPDSTTANNPDDGEQRSDLSTLVEKVTLDHAWGRMLEHLLNEGRKHAHSALIQVKPVLNNQSEIEIPVEHDALRTALELLQFELTNQLRRWTGIADMRLKLVIATPDARSASYATISEKKQRLMGRYPKINPFINKIGLEWSY